MPPLSSKISSLSLCFLAELKGLGSITAASIFLVLTIGGHSYESHLADFSGPSMLFQFKDQRELPIIRTADCGGAFQLVLKTASSMSTPYQINISDLAMDVVSVSAVLPMALPFEEAVLPSQVFVLHSARQWAWPMIASNPTVNTVWVSTPVLAQRCAKVVVTFQLQILCSVPFVAFQSIRLELCLLRSQRVIAVCPLISLHSANCKQLLNQLLTVAVDPFAHDPQVQRLLLWATPGDCLAVRRTLLADPLIPCTLLLANFRMELHGAQAGFPCFSIVRTGALLRPAPSVGIVLSASSRAIPSPVGSVVSISPVPPPPPQSPVAKVLAVDGRPLQTPAAGVRPPPRVFPDAEGQWNMPGTQGRHQSQPAKQRTRTAGTIRAGKRRGRAARKGKNDNSEGVDEEGEDGAGDEGELEDDAAAAEGGAEYDPEAGYDDMQSADYSQADFGYSADCSFPVGADLGQQADPSLSDNAGYGMWNGAGSVDVASSWNADNMFAGGGGMNMDYGAAWSGGDAGGFTMGDGGGYGYGGDSGYYY